MAIVKYRDVVQDAAGNVIAGATVTILDTGTATPSTLYQDDAVTPLANPLTSDATGGFEFSIEEGTYDISVARTGYTTVVQDKVTIGGAGGGGGGEDYVTINSAGALPTAAAPEGISIGGDVTNSGTRAVVVGGTANTTSTDASIFGYGSTVTGSGGAVFGRSSTAASLAVAVGYTATASGASSIATGYLSQATGDQGVAYGVGARGNANQGSAFGTGAWSTHAASTAVGYNARTTKANQVVLGTAAEETHVPGTFVVGKSIAESVASLPDGSNEIDMLAASVFTKTLTGDVTLTLTNLTAGGAFTLVITNSGAARQITFGTGFSGVLLWPAPGTQPTETTGIDVYEFFCPVTGGGALLLGALASSYTPA